jgi:hypothetical protein
LKINLAEERCFEIELAVEEGCLSAKVLLPLLRYLSSLFFICLVYLLKKWLEALSKKRMSAFENKPGKNAFKCSIKRGEVIRRIVLENELAGEE